VPFHDHHHHHNHHILLKSNPTLFHPFSYYYYYYYYQEPLKTKVLSREKVFFKRLVWSPKLVGQPVGPLKGEWW